MRHKVKWWCSLSLVQHRTTVVFILFSLFPTLLGVYTQEHDINMPHQEVEFWARKIGNHIFHLSNAFALYNDIKDNFHSRDATLQENDGLQLVKEMASDVTNMMKFKVDAVNRIMNVAEEASLDKYKQDEAVDYFNAKRLNPSPDIPQEAIDDKNYRNLSLLSNSHFDGIPINESVSSVHVPTNVYAKAPDVINAIRWSGRLDRTFKSNYELDPTLSWQYFGSSTGFLRQYPASEWVMDEKDPDLYDARLRSWYIQAASSPKDMVILLDVSGSMTGLRKEIAIHVVLNILETLNENDFVNIFNFSTETTELVSCFNDSLVQANMENIGEFKKALKTIETKEIANFSKALIKAFELLQRYNKSGQGSQCNQAIMVVTDGAPDNYEKIFSTYNWPHFQVRVFTYLIGREEKKKRDLSWMACANKGYFVQVTTLAEVREQVLRYIPVMARPMVMYQEDHHHIWTGVYADIATPVDVLAEIKIASRPEKAFPGRRGAPGLKEGYRLMTSVAVPVFDRKKTSTKTANLLGVAGTDVPIREIEKLVPPYKLGVNGYSFMVNSNGYVIYHPDLRPVHRESNAEFQDILKPNYNSVDFAEVELTDYENEARANDSELLELRKELVEQNPAERMMNVKIHLDDMKRVVQRTQKYFAQKISGTPFSLGIAMPDGYGKYKVHGQIELTREIQDRRAGDVMDHFSTGNWSLHPDWVYCEYKYDQHQEDQSPEALIKEFLSRAQKPNWKWRSTRTRPPPDPIMNQAQHKRWKPSMGSDERKDNYYCDKDLVQSLLFDARATNVYSREVKIEDKIKDKNMGSQNFGITTAFVATRSGLTRWIDNPSESSSSNGNSKERHFMKVHNRAIDEVWYKRAVDYYKEDQDAYVYSVPFDAATRDPDEVLVTATRAIFVEENEYRMAPAAVVGVTIKHRKFVDFFKNETYKCPSYPSRDSSCKKAKTCESTSLNCYLLDDNGFIIASENEDDTGKFFGTLEGTIMESLVQSEVYKKIQVFDYQAVCLDTQEKNSMASILTTPIQTLKWFANWMMGNVFWVLVKTQLYTLWDPNEAWAYAQGQWDPNAAPTDEVTYSKGPINHQSTFGEYQEMFPDEAGIPTEDTKRTESPDVVGDFPPLELAYINKTHPRPCDKTVYLYKLQSKKLKQDGLYKPVKGKLSNCHTNGCGRPFSVQKVISTNLILVAVNSLCPCESRKVDIEPVEVEHNETTSCNRLLMQHYRKRPQSCVNYHPDEHEIKLCGGAGSLGPSSVALLTLLLAHIYNSMMQS
ncbi:voltage-dependent calcium channel subunit alpha-2/delta-3-like isoform X24 [Portunus trituberculatus]|uniref:voltage-dependent calcium channel subunit alpha-2/delta-3-like isoform X24 n=1 Tax=Portunus trituberculatus TaxID=210409 RepID=UPI001E1CD740|nr:voltage-dependent calcium channel subunit alpha-2/delta-3-like isoform X24 [Portunus trituberculatus]